MLQGGIKTQRLRLKNLRIMFPFLSLFLQLNHSFNSNMYFSIAFFFLFQYVQLFKLIES